MAAHLEEDISSSTTPSSSVNAERNSISPLASVPHAPKDAMFGLSAAYRADTHPKKVDLGVGAYRDDNAKPWVLPVVKKVQYPSPASQLYGLTNLTRQMTSSARRRISTMSISPSPD